MSEAHQIIGDLIECEVCGPVRDAGSEVWKLAYEIGNDFPACPKCVVEAGEAAASKNDHAAICAVLKAWSKSKEKMR